MVDAGVIGTSLEQLLDFIYVKTMAVCALMVDVELERKWQTLRHTEGRFDRIWSLMWHEG